MDERFKKTTLLLVFITFLFFLVGSYFLYKNEIKDIEDKVHNTLSHQTYHFKEYFSISESFLYAMKYTIEDKLMFDNGQFHNSYKNLNYDKNKNIYTLCNNRTSLIGKGAPKDFSKGLIKELNSTLYLTPLFFSAKKLITDMSRIYYKSKNDFIFFSQTLGYKDKDDFQSLYKKHSWDEFIKNQYKNKNMIITNNYNEYGNKEYFLTLSLPIYTKNEFKGLISIEKNLKTLNEYLNRIILKDNSYLIDNSNRIVVSKKLSLINTKIENKNSKILKIPIIENQLYLVHLLDKSRLKKEALYKSSGKILILLLLIIISIILIYLKLVLTKVQYLATIDPLTKLLNRRVMKESIENQIEISKRYNQDLSFLLVDIDFFKKVNDNYGHQIGDLVLIEVSNLFKSLIRSSDIAARYGGEEFLIVLTNTDIQEAFILAERIRKLSNKIKIKDIDLNLTVSIGCCTLKDGDTYETILKKVDELMYEAKQTGRNKSVKEAD